MASPARWLPQSLFGRLVLVLAGGLLVAQLLSAAINLAERDRLLHTAGGRQQAQRIADAVMLLDGLGPAERERIASVLSVPPLVLSLPSDAPASALAPARTAAPPASALAPAGTAGALAPADASAALFTSELRDLLGPQRAIHVVASPATWPSRPPPPYRAHHMGGPAMGNAPGPAMHEALHPGPVLRTEVQLRDGQWARFDTELLQPDATLPWRLALTLGILLAAVLLLSLLAVRWVTRPLATLAAAAEGLGRDIHRPPLPEDGPREIRQAAHAFNTMQARLAGFIADRTRVFAAMSHDLKTPITRMRLRAELMDDAALRQQFEGDLAEMEAMVTDTLAFMRGLGGTEARRPVDVAALLESLRADNEAMGRSVTIEGEPAAPLVAVPSLLKRCLSNLVDNATTHGGRATVQVADTPAALTLRILDEGPGIPEAELAAVFEPFYRVEASRNRATGGTGLGLGIARNIAQMHEGDLQLRNRPAGGLEVTLRLPRHPGA